MEILITKKFEGPYGKGVMVQKNQIRRGGLQFQPKKKRINLIDK
jgi:hypothetical protein